MKLRHVLATALVLLTTPAIASESPEITERVERISNAVMCISINDFAIRQMNTFIMEMEIINPSPDKSRLSASAAMVAMSVNMRMDVFKTYKELRDLGYDEAVLKKTIDSIESEVIARYIAWYMKSTDQAKAMEFVTNMIKEQQTCADWYSKVIKPGLAQQQGGVDG